MKKKIFGHASSPFGDEALSAVSKGNKLSGTYQRLLLNQLRSGKYQPRKNISDKELQELKNSILEQGVLQPILVRELTKPESGISYEIIAGERRWRASQLAGVSDIPAVIKQCTDKEA